jgi:hypothetical protein
MTPAAYGHRLGRRHPGHRCVRFTQRGWLRSANARSRRTDRRTLHQRCSQSRCHVPFPHHAMVQHPVLNSGSPAVELLPPPEGHHEAARFSSRVSLAISIATAVLATVTVCTSPRFAHEAIILRDTRLTCSFARPMLLVKLQASAFCSGLYFDAGIFAPIMHLVCARERARLRLPNEWRTSLSVDAPL